MTRVHGETGQRREIHAVHQLCRFQAVVEDGARARRHRQRARQRQQQVHGKDPPEDTLPPPNQTRAAADEPNLHASHANQASSCAIACVTNSQQTESLRVARESGPSVLLLLKKSRSSSTLCSGSTSAETT